MLVLYGLKNCDTCRKALKEIEASGNQIVLHDVRADPVSPEKLQKFLDAFGGKLVNTRSTTWRGLSEKERSESPLSLLKSHPTLMKRPVIEGAGNLTLGWDQSVRDQYKG